MAINTKKPAMKQTVGAQYTCFANATEAGDYDGTYEADVEKTEVVKSVKVTENSETSDVYASGKIYDSDTPMSSIDIEISVIAFPDDTISKMRGETKGVGVLITILLFVTSILIAMFIVKNKISSNASNDGWLGFFGGLFGSFISGMITFYVLYIDRKGSREQIFKQQKVMEMNQMENDLKEVFSSMKKDGDCVVATTYILLVLNKIPESYKDTKYYKLLFEIGEYSNEGQYFDALELEAKLYREFIKYRNMYIETYNCKD